MKPALGAPKAHHHYDLAAGINRAHIKAEVAKVNTVNAKLAVLVTNIVGSMWCAYAFCLLALLSLPAVLAQFSVFATVFPAWLVKASLIALVAWVAQTFIQLVLLSVIMVGQTVQSQASDARAAQTETNTETLVRLLSLDEQGGITDLRDELVRLITERCPAPKEKP
ncbi:MAG: hypothetical protein KGH75_00160 [Rhodospirillales bacterium]|nr:hypothetical protein [Rhodospirillales bacterium]